MSTDVFEDHAGAVLEQVARELLESEIDARDLVRPHIWRDSDYVGIADGRAAVWRGVSLNLGRLQKGLRGLHIDKVANILPERERVSLFGEDFAAAIRPYSEFVALFGTGFRTARAAQITEHGLIPSRLPNALHACNITGVQQFLATAVDEWSRWAMIVVQIQRELADQP